MDFATLQYYDTDVVVNLLVWGWGSSMVSGWVHVTEKLIPNDLYKDDMIIWSVLR